MECPFLQEARKHEHTGLANPDSFPNRDIKVSEQFLEDHEDLLIATARGLTKAAFDAPGAVDAEVRDALDAMIRTYRTLQSGVYYETRPESVPANQVYRSLQEALQKFRETEAEDVGMRRSRDTDVLGVLVFLQHLELDRNNGRPRGRAFLDFLWSYFGEGQGAAPAPRMSSLILP